MKKTLSALVARIDGKVVFFEGIQDLYTPVTVTIEKEDVQNLDFKAKENVLEMTSKNWWVIAQDSSLILGEQEAKDQSIDVGNLKIDMESFEVEV